MSRTSTVLLILILVITFPVWIALAAVVFGLTVGIFGGLIGLVGGIFGAIMGLIGSLFGLIFGSPDLHFGWDWPDFHFNRYVFFALLIVVALVISKRQRR
jgi:MFS family permease